MKLPMIALGTILCACAPKPITSPVHTMRVYLTSIDRNRPDIAYGLMGADAKKRITLEEFSHRWQTLRPELQIQARKLRRALKNASPTRRAKLVPPNGSGIQLTREGGRWKLDRGIPLGHGTRTPRSALKSFVRAVEERNYRAVMRLLAPSVAQSIETDIDGRLRQLKQSLKNMKIRSTNNRASLRYGRGKHVKLVRDSAGDWRIEDFD
jgi:hypothetical protein